MTADNDQPSATAMRAAKKIDDKSYKWMTKDDMFVKNCVEIWAEIIDRETGVGEMLEACRIAHGALTGLAYSDWSDRGGPDACRENAIKDLDSAIAKGDTNVQETKT